MESRCHSVGAKASKTKPAKLLAVFVVDTNETGLTIPFGTEVTRGDIAKVIQQSRCLQLGKRYAENLP